jgi:hypothetical protein
MIAIAASCSRAARSATPENREKCSFSREKAGLLLIWQHERMSAIGDETAACVQEQRRHPCSEGRLGDFPIFDAAGFRQGARRSRLKTQSGLPPSRSKYSGLATTQTARD